MRFNIFPKNNVKRFRKVLKKAKESFFLHAVSKGIFKVRVVTYTNKKHLYYSVFEYSYSKQNSSDRQDVAGDGGGVGESSAQHEISLIP